MNPRVEYHERRLHSFNGYAMAVIGLLLLGYGILRFVAIAEDGPSLGGALIALLLVLLGPFTWAGIYML